MLFTSFNCRVIAATDYLGILSPREHISDYINYLINFVNPNPKLSINLNFTAAKFLFFLDLLSFIYKQPTYLKNNRALTLIDPPPYFSTILQTLAISTNLKFLYMLTIQLSTDDLDYFQFTTYIENHHKLFCIWRDYYR